MKKFFTILPIFNVIIAFFYMILWNNMDSFENDAGFVITLFVMIILDYLLVDKILEFKNKN